MPCDKSASWFCWWVSRFSVSCALCNNNQMDFFFYISKRGAEEHSETISFVSWGSLFYYDGRVYFAPLLCGGPRHHVDVVRCAPPPRVASINSQESPKLQMKADEPFLLLLLIRVLVVWQRLSTCCQLKSEEGGIGGWRVTCICLSLSYLCKGPTFCPNRQEKKLPILLLAWL